MHVLNDCDTLDLFYSHDINFKNLINPLNPINSLHPTYPLFSPLTHSLSGRMQQLEVDESFLVPAALTTSALALSYLMYRQAFSLPSQRSLPPGGLYYTFSDDK